MEKRLERIKGHAARIHQVTAEINFNRIDPETAHELSLRLARVVGVCEARSKMILDEMAPNAVELADMAERSRAAAEAISALKPMQPTIQIQQIGRYINATATAPDGCSWDGLHQLVVSWMCPKTTRLIRQKIEELLRERIREAGPLTECPDDCECRED